MPLGLCNGFFTTTTGVITMSWIITIIVGLIVGFIAIHK